MKKTTQTEVRIGIDTMTGPSVLFHGWGYTLDEAKARAQIVADGAGHPVLVDFTFGAQRIAFFQVDPASCSHDFRTSVCSKCGQIAPNNRNQEGI